MIAPSWKKVSLGVDIEILHPKIMQETADIFTTSYEQDLLFKCSIPYEAALLITFSAKESFFKALYPQTQKFFDFKTALICELNNRRNQFNLQLNQTLTPAFTSGYRLSGSYHLRGTEVITLIAAKIRSS